MPSLFVSITISSHLKFRPRGHSVLVTIATLTSNNIFFQVWEAVVRSGTKKNFLVVDPLNQDYNRSDSIRTNIQIISNAASFGTWRVVCTLNRKICYTAISKSRDYKEGPLHSKKRKVLLS